MGRVESGLCWSLWLVGDQIHVWKAAKDHLSCHSFSKELMPFRICHYSHHASFWKV